MATRELKMCCALKVLHATWWDFVETFVGVGCESLLLQNKFSAGGMQVFLCKVNVDPSVTCFRIFLLMYSPTWLKQLANVTESQKREKVSKEHLGKISNKGLNDVFWDHGMCGNWKSRITGKDRIRSGLGLPVIDP